MSDLIITEKAYYRFADTGLLGELPTVKNRSPSNSRESLQKEVEEVALQMGSEKKAREMKLKGYDIKEITALAGLTKATIKRIKGKET